MKPLETAVTLAMAIVLLAVGVFFVMRQRNTMRSLQFGEEISTEQRRYLLKQNFRRTFGSLLLLLLSGMLVGSLFLNYDLLRQPLKDLGPDEQEASKQSLRFISFYWMTFLLFLMALMSLAVLDLWATARHGVQMQKKLFQEHQALLEAELAQKRQRRAELN